MPLLRYLVYLPEVVNVNSDPDAPTVPSKRSKLATYVIVTLLAMVVLSFLVEAFMAYREVRGLDLDLLSKLLDTLTEVLSSIMGE